MLNLIPRRYWNGLAPRLACVGLLAVTAASAFADPVPKLFANRNDVAPANSVPIVEVGPVDLQAVQAEDQTNEQAGMPTRIAVPFPVSMTPDDSGLWETLSDGGRLWRLRIAGEGARHINLGFSHYDMPAGGELVIYSADQSEVIRAFTSDDVQDHGQLWTPIVRSEEIVIEVRLPAGVSSNDLSLELGQIGYGYRGFGADPIVLASPRSGSCNVDVVCPEGAPWAGEIPSVGVYTLNGFWTCTGAMINNTAENQVPYFLTANHCSINSGNAGTMVIYWNFENSTCRTPGSGASGGAGNGSLSQFSSGATYRAGSSASDFTLVQINSSPSPAWGVTFSGWSRSTGNASSAVCIHHPNTDEKRISFENDPVSTTSYYGTGTPGDGSHIRITDWDLGTTEPGSSGSPLYNPQHQIIGQLHGGDAACGNNLSDWFGRFSVSWTGGGSNSTRLSNWLDPIGSGATTLNTLIPGGGSAVCGNGIQEVGETCDDGNTTSGDGCSSTCQIEVIPSDGDECFDCIPIGDGTISGTTSDNTGAGNDSSCGGTGDVIDEWYCYTAPCTGTATASTCNPGTDFDTTLAVYSACGGSEIACNDDAVGSPAACSLSGLNRKSVVTWSVSSGTTYYVRVSGYNGATGDFDLTLSCSGSNPCPNDTIASPTVIASLPYTGTGTTASCTDNYNEVCPFDLTGAPDVVYAYTPPGNQTIDINMCASSYDTKVYIYAGSVTPGSPVACNDDGCPGSAPASYRSSLTGVALTGGVTYYIIVDGYSDVDSGNFELIITGTTVVECTVPGDCDDNDPCTFNDCIGNDCVFTIIDSDNDGEPDCTDLCPNDPFKITPGTCGCGNADTPADGDLNADGSVNGLDAQSMVDGLMNGTNTWYNCHGDFNNSGQLDVGDISGLVAAILGS
ncbi:MAG: trypsin-like peptidase domain-containing protein [Phycisphaerales bacterium]|nr:trypsin-like peptidase domain-containing protein [Phycisphaerales bacterium]MCB9862702.1 trypsin-like peptidase domain-containing protein [Phycisphaerales bacterium]